MVMDRSERFYKIDQLLIHRKAVPVSVFTEELGISLATFKRDLEYLRDRLNAPIVWDRDAGGYRYEQPATNSPVFSLPGLWFNASEAHALLLMQKLLKDIQPGLLGPQIEPLQTRLKAILGSEDHSMEEVESRFRLIHAARRITPLPHFESIASATLNRQQIDITHYNRERDDTTQRRLSPQKIVFYRDNWYLDAWCHLREGLRSFSIDTIRTIETVDAPALDIETQILEDHFKHGYGIFAGQIVQWAKLRFSRERARWVSSESWHPEQRASLDDSGRYLLEIPYSDERELIMDVLRHGDAVEVLEPAALRDHIQRIFTSALTNYSL